MKKIYAYAFGGVAYFLIRILFRVIFNYEIEILWTAVEAVIWLALFALTIEIILPKIFKKK